MTKTCLKLKPNFQRKKKCEGKPRPICLTLTKTPCPSKMSDFPTTSSSGISSMLSGVPSSESVSSLEVNSAESLKSLFLECMNDAESSSESEQSEAFSSPYVTPPPPAVMAPIGTRRDGTLVPHRGEDAFKRKEMLDDQTTARTLLSSLRYNFRPLSFKCDKKASHVNLQSLINIRRIVDRLVFADKKHRFSLHPVDLAADIDLRMQYLRVVDDYFALILQVTYDGSRGVELDWAATVDVLHNLFVHIELTAELRVSPMDIDNLITIFLRGAVTLLHVYHVGENNLVHNTVVKLIRANFLLQYAMNNNAGFDCNSPKANGFFGEINNCHQSILMTVLKPFWFYEKPTVAQKIIQINSQGGMSNVVKNQLILNAFRAWKSVMEPIPSNVLLLRLMSGIGLLDRSPFQLGPGRYEPNAEECLSKQLYAGRLNAWTLPKGEWIHFLAERQASENDGRAQFVAQQNVEREAMAHQFARAQIERDAQEKRAREQAERDAQAKQCARPQMGYVTQRPEYRGDVRFNRAVHIPIAAPSHPLPEPPAMVFNIPPPPPSVPLLNHLLCASASGPPGPPGSSVLPPMPPKQYSLNNQQAMNITPAVIPIFTQINSTQSRVPRFALNKVVNSSLATFARVDPLNEFIPAPQIHWPEL